MNFKGVQTLWEKSGKFTKIRSQHDLHKSEFIWAHLYAKIWSSNTSVKMNWFQNKKGVWIWNSNHTSLIIQTKLLQDFIQTSTVYSEALLQQCSYYSNTRGVTMTSMWGTGRRQRTPSTSPSTAAQHGGAHPWLHHPAAIRVEERSDNRELGPRHPRGGECWWPNLARLEKADVPVSFSRSSGFVSFWAWTG
jgi:hypothetical protein